MFTLENTSGYTQQELDVLNAELEIRLEGIEPGNQEYTRIEKQFSDEVANGYK